MDEAERLAEIAELAKNQLSHKRDLPRRGETKVRKKWLAVKEIPCDPDYIEYLIIVGKKIYHWKSEPPPVWPGCTVCGREWTISG